MEYNECLDLVHQVQRHVWFQNLSTLCENGKLSDWVSKFHPDQVRCQIDATTTLINGGYNTGQKFIFEDGSIWFLRLVQKGSVCDELADEKVAMEVEALTLIKENTDIPVPTIRGWGFAADNPLTLGPFIILDFIAGVSLESVLKERPDKRLMRDDIDDRDVEFIFKQFARILLQLFQFNFHHIGSLPTPVTGYQVPIRPLSDRTQGFVSTTDFFGYIVSQDWEQLLKQPNSVGGEFDGKDKMQAFSALRTLLPEFIHKDYDKGPFKLVCEDFGLANLIVRNHHDLTIVGVVDLEWSYAGPAQLAASPWWLLQSRLTLYDLEISEEAKKSATILDRYLKNLDIFIRVLKQEERGLIASQGTLSPLVEWSRESGAMWLHMLLHTGFNYVGSIPFVKLREHIGLKKWRRIKDEVMDHETLGSLVRTKIIHLERYDEILEEIKVVHDKFSRGEMDAQGTLEALNSLCEEIEKNENLDP
ncbi:hypothetical protein EIK77_005246 [Talaromyces pinophilus]|nr:hypothetical protein EIK77_005246 [Talaromyces pinophilus]